MKNFDLFIYSCGNGTCISNKAVSSGGEYQKVAHISEHGVIKTYIPENCIPSEAMDKIKAIAERSKSDFMQKWEKFDYLRKYEHMMDIPTIGCGYNAFALVDAENKHLPLVERVAMMEKVFFETHM